MRQREFRWAPPLLAYGVAVSLGCFIVGLLIGIYGVFWRQEPPTSLAFYALSAPLIGFLPGAVLALPGVLLSAWLRRRYGQLGVPWYWVMGFFTGILTAVPIYLSLAWTGAGVSELLIVGFAIAGGCAGVASSKVEAALKWPIGGPKPLAAFGDWLLTVKRLWWGRTPGFSVVG